MYEWGLGIVGIDRRIDWKDLLETPLSCRLEDSYIRKVMELCEDDFNKLMNELSLSRSPSVLRCPSAMLSLLYL